ncbi:rhomboid family intramembrane serine protease [Candidatus Sumerlaeota bacterium]|nr:rhomboid family intramembrane serine protease [Candidatus Sumerlaeota bacterium]
MFFVLPYGVDRPLYRRPTATYALLGVNALVFVVQFFIVPLTGSGSRADSIQSFVDRFGYTSIAQPLGLLTHQFVHGGFFHFFWNMYFLYLIGAILEDRIGRSRLLLVYLVGGCVGAFLQKSVTDDALPLVGASGSIAAMMGAFFIITPWCDFKVYYFIWVLWRVFAGQTKCPSILLLGMYFFLGDLVDALIARSGGGTSSVAYWAHVGGFLFGAIVSALFYGFKAFAHTEAELQLDEARVQLALSRAIREKGAASARNAVSPSASEEIVVGKDPSAAVLEHFVEIGDVEKAGREFGRLVDRNPYFSLAPAPQFALAEMLAAAKRRDLALSVFDNLITAHPRSIQAQASLLTAGKLALESTTTRPRSLSYFDRFLRSKPSKEEEAEVLSLIKELNATLGGLDTRDFSPDVEQEVPKTRKTSSVLPALPTSAREDSDSGFIDLDLPEPPAASPGSLGGAGGVSGARHEIDESQESGPISILFENHERHSVSGRRGESFPELAPSVIALGEILGPGAAEDLTEQEARVSRQAEESYEDDTEKIVRAAVRRAAEGLDGRESAHITDSAILRPPNQNRKRPVSSREASCAMIVAPRREIDFDRLLGELSAILAQTPQILADRLRLQCGIVLRDVSYSQGVEIRDRLLRAGLPIRLIENRRSLDFSACCEAVGLEIHSDRLLWRTVSGEAEMGARSIGVLACGMVRLSPEATHYSSVVDVFQFHPALHVRLWGGSFPVDKIKGVEGLNLRPTGPIDTEGMRILAHRLAQQSHEIVQTYATREWLSPGGPKEPRAFRHIGSYDDYNRWHILAYFAAEAE